MRTSSTQLPSYKELVSILESEEKRVVPKENTDKHFGDFSTIIELLNSFGLQTDFFTKNFSFEDYKQTSLFNEVVLIFDSLIKKIDEFQEDIEKVNLYNNLYDYLSEEDISQKSDIAFVFGSKSKFRIEKAIEIYKEGMASKIMISGRGPFYEENSTSEAEELSSFAIEEGVSEEDLILEKEAITLPDNVKRSLNLLEKNQIPHKNIILVNSPFSQRRGWAHFKKMSIPETNLYRVNAEVSDTFSKNGWYKNKVGRQMIVKEFFGLRMSEALNTS